MEGSTAEPTSGVFVGEGEIRWWTFAGGRINTTLRHALEALGASWKIVPDNFGLTIAASRFLRDATTVHIQTTRTVRLYRVGSSDGLLTGSFYTPDRPEAASPSIDLVFGVSQTPRVDRREELTVPAGAHLFIGTAAEPPQPVSSELLGRGFHVYVSRETLGQCELTDSGEF